MGINNYSIVGNEIDRRKWEWPKRVDDMIKGNCGHDEKKDVVPVAFFDAT